MANPYITIQPSAAGLRLARAHFTWLTELQQWQLATWRHVALVSIGFVSLTWALPSPPHSPTVAERMASRSMRVVVGDK